MLNALTLNFPQVKIQTSPEGEVTVPVVTLTSDDYHLTLLPLTEDHADVYIALANEPSIIERVNNPQPYAREHFDLLIADIASKERFFTWMIMQGNVVCGAINAASLNHKEKFQGGYWLDPAHRGNGLAGKALTLVNDFLFVELHAARVQALVEPDNAASIRTLEKAGYQREAVLKKYYPTRRRGLVDVCMYARFKESA